jgi:hypothetical protein
MNDYESRHYGDHNNHVATGDLVLERKATREKVKELAKNTHLNPNNILCCVKTAKEYMKRLFINPMNILKV